VERAFLRSRLTQSSRRAGPRLCNAISTSDGCCDALPGATSCFLDRPRHTPLAAICAVKRDSSSYGQTTIPSRRDLVHTMRSPNSSATDTFWFPRKSSRGTSAHRTEPGRGVKRTSTQWLPPRWGWTPAVQKAGWAFNGDAIRVVDERRWKEVSIWARRLSNAVNDQCP
jgi:hypothetical protein